MEGIDLTPFVNAGVPGLVLLWFMFRMEKVLRRFEKTINLIARTMLRQLETHNPTEASRLSKELYGVNGDSDA